MQRLILTILLNSLRVIKGKGNMANKYLSFVLFSAFALAGCESLEEINETQERVETAISKEMKLVDILKNDKHRYQNVTFSNTIFVAPTSREEAKKPSWWFKKLRGGRGVDSRMEDAVALIVGSGVNVNYGRNVHRYKKVSYSGKTVGEALDSIASASGYSYKISSKNKIIWSMYETRSFKVANLNGTDFFGQGKGKGESSSDDKAITAESEYVNAVGEVDALDELYRELLTYSSFKKQVALTTNSYQSQLPLPPPDEVASGETAKTNQSEEIQDIDDKSIPIFLNRSASTITVRDTPAVLDEMEKIVNERNNLFRTNVYLEIDIIEVKMTNEAQQAIDVSAVISDIGDTLIKTGVTAGTAASQIGRASVSLPTNVISAELTGGKLKGTALLMEALSYYGTVSSRTMPRQTMQPNSAAKLADIENFFFIKERKSNSTANVGTEATIEQEDKDVGFSLYVMPTIFKNDVTLRMATNISALIELTRNGDTTTSAGGSSNSTSSYVESPRTSKKDFIAKFTVTAGDTMVLSGLSREIKSIRRGKGISEYLASSDYGKSERIETFITVTPKIQRPRH